MCICKDNLSHQINGNGKPLWQRTKIGRGEARREKTILETPEQVRKMRLLTLNNWSEVFSWANTSSCSSPSQEMIYSCRSLLSLISPFSHSQQQHTAFHVTDQLTE